MCDITFFCFACDIRSWFLQMNMSHGLKRSCPFLYNMPLYLWYISEHLYGRIPLSCLEGTLWGRHVSSGHTHRGVWQAGGRGHALTGPCLCPRKNSPLLTKVHNHKLLNVNSAMLWYGNKGDKQGVRTGYGRVTCGQPGGLTMASYWCFHVDAKRKIQVPSNGICSQEVPIHWANYFP